MATLGDRSLILVDVDGVLNPSFSAKTRRRLAYHEGWLQRRVDAGGLTFRVFLNPAHGEWLRTLASQTGAELAWGTTWEEYANLCIGPLIGLPRLPVAPVPPSVRCKAEAFVPWTAGRPFVWFDDEPGAAEITARLAAGQPHLVVRVDQRTGLTEDHISRAHDWLAHLAATPDQQS